jgi:hypothetical protein
MVPSYLLIENFLAIVTDDDTKTILLLDVEYQTITVSDTELFVL